MSGQRHRKLLRERARNGKQRATVATVVALCLSLVPMGSAEADHGSFRIKPGSVEMVTVNSRGEPQEGTFCGSNPSISDDGRFVAFHSDASNLHPADGNGPLTDVFVRDRKLGQTLLISKTLQGTSPQPPNDLSQLADGVLNCQQARWSYRPTISGNGRYVVYTSLAPMTNVEHDRPAKTLPFAKVFLYDMKEETTELVSVAKNGDAPNSDAGEFGADVSNDGRFIVFKSQATNLVDMPECALVPDLPVTLPNSPVHDCNNQTYLYDRKTKKNTLVTKTPDGQLPNNAYTLLGQAQTQPQLSDDGRYVVFGSKANNLVDNDVNVCTGQVPSCEDIYRYDVKRNRIELVSVGRDGLSGNSDSYSADMLANPGQIISADGRFITFWSQATDLVPAGGQGAFVRDMKTKRTERVSVLNYGGAGGGFRPDISDDGRYVSFIGRYCVHSSQILVTNATGCPTATGDTFSGEFFHDRNIGQTDAVQTYHPGDGGPQRKPESHGWSISGSGRQAVWGQIGDDYDDSPLDLGLKKDQIFVRDFGVEALGVGSLGFGGAPPEKQEPPEDRICIAPDVCIPPQGKVSQRAKARTADALTAAKGAKLYGASLAYRPEQGDLFAAVDVEHMGPVLGLGSAGLVAGGNPSVLYGLRFQSSSKSYEVRATSLLGGTFGLFDCTASCTKVADLRGGYGTTGERVVFSLPLEEIGLGNGGKLKNIEAFSGLGNYLTGVAKVLDTVSLK